MDTGGEGETIQERLIFLVSDNIFLAENRFPKFQMLNNLSFFIGGGISARRGNDDFMDNILFRKSGTRQ